MADEDKQQMYRDAVKADRQKWESEQAHDKGVADRAREAITDEAKKN